MNSREKQRRALHANKGVVAAVRQLPLYMKVINVVLAIVLALGVGSNWAYAAELLPDAPEATNTTESVTVDYGTSQTLYAPSASDASSYVWEVFSPEINDWALIGGEEGSSLVANSELLSDAMKEDRTAEVRVRVLDSSEEQVNSKTFVVTLGEEPSIADLVQQANKVEAETVSVNDASDQAGEENAANFTVKIKFYDMAGKDLGYEFSNPFTLTAEKGFDWTVRVNTELGSIYSLTVPDKFKDVLTATSASISGFNDSIYVVGQKEIYSMPDTEVEIKATFNVASYYYTINASYQQLDNPGVYDPYTYTNSAPLETVIPTTEETKVTSESDEAFLIRGMGRAELGTGWKIEEKRTDVVRNTNQPDAGQDPSGKGVQVSVKLVREYGVLTFDCNGGSNGPAAVYMKNGEDFDTITKWKISDTQYAPYPAPIRNAYTFANWYYMDDSGRRVDMPTNWKGEKAPGVKRVYYANWTPNSQDDVKITIAYWTETVDSTDANRQYEYSIERYAMVPYSRVGTPYTVPSDRYYPQVRVPGQEVEVTSEIEYITGTQDNDDDSSTHRTYGYRYNELYTQPQSETVTVQGDGTTVVKVKLNRVKRDMIFTRGGYTSQTITARWDADITNEYKQVCQTLAKADNCIWTSDKTDFVCTYLVNMPKYRTTGTQTADTWRYSKAANGKRYINYYLHTVNNSSENITSGDHPRGQSGSQVCVNAIPTGDQASHWQLLTAEPIGATFNYTTVDEYISLLGFKTPTAGTDGPRTGSGIHQWADNEHYCYFYYRNFKGVYLRNIHGVNDSPTEGQYKGVPYHQDLCIAIGRDYTDGSIQDLPYQKLVGDFVFLDDEKSEFVQGTYESTGATGIEEGMVLKNFTPTVPNTEDKHFVFDGWFTDPNFNEDAKVDLETFTMPNHEQDLYAHWVPPECKLAFDVVTDPSRPSETEVAGPTETDTYTLPIDQGQVPVIDTHEGYKFQTWYYYASSDDQRDNIKSWFDPNTMTMPFVEWGERTNNAGEPIMVLHQQWAEDKDVDYRFKFVLAGTDTEVAAPVDGRSKADTEVSYKASDKPAASFYEGFIGVLKLAEGQQDEIKMTLTYNFEDNIRVFYYEYDDTKQFNYRIEYWAVYPDGSPAEKLATNPPETEDSWIDASDPSGWKATENHKMSVTITPDINKFAARNLTLYSASAITITLRSDAQRDPGEDPAVYAHPSQNIVEVYYAPDSDVQFNYEAKTWTTLDDQTDPLPGHYGGKVDPGSQSVSPYTGTGKSTATLYDGFEFQGWWSTKLDENGVRVKDQKVDDKYVSQVGNKYELTVPKPWYIYVSNETYWAIFTPKTTDATITYKIKVINGLGQETTEANIKLKIGTAGTEFTDSQSETLTNQVTKPQSVSQTSKVSYYPFTYWLDATQRTVSTSDPYTTPFNALPAGHVYDGTEDGYDYWTSTTYTCVFDERTLNRAVLTYQVATDDQDVGRVQLTGSPQRVTSVSESVWPFSGNPDAEIGTVFSASAISINEVWVFDYWERSGDPGKEYSKNVKCPVYTVNDETSGNPYYVTQTYTAHFKLGYITVKFTTDGNGTLNENSAERLIPAGSAYKVDTTGKLLFYEANLTDPLMVPVDPTDPDSEKVQLTMTPNGYLGYQPAVPAWKYVGASGDVDLDNKPIMEDKTFKAMFTYQTGVKMNYYVYGGDNSVGYLDTGYQHVQTYEQSVANPVSGTITPPKATANEGYAFDYWSIDDDYTHKYSGSQDDGSLVIAQDGTDPHKAFQSHRFYAHFKTFDCTVTIDIYNSFKEQGEIFDPEEGEVVESYSTTVQSMTPYFYDKSISASGAEGNLYLDISQQTDPPTTPTATARHNSTATTYEFSNWMIEINPTTHATTGLPAAGSSDCVIKGNIHFVAFLQVQGNVDYTIKYWFETVDSAKNRLKTDPEVPVYPTIPTSDTGDAWDSWQQYKDAASADPAGRTYPDITGQAAGGSSVNIQTPAVIGFKYATTFDSSKYPEGFYANPDIQREGEFIGQWLIVQGQTNTFNIFYIRDTNYEFEIDTYTETTKSASDHSTDPELSSNRLYAYDYTLPIFTWAPTDVPGVTPYQTHLHGIYGQTVVVPKDLFPGQSTNQIKFLEYNCVTPHINSETGEVDPDHFDYIVGSYYKPKEDVTAPDPFKQIDLEESLQDKVRTAADTPNKGILNISFNKYTNLDFPICVHLQHLNDGEYDATPNYIIGMREDWRHSGADKENRIIVENEDHIAALNNVTGATVDLFNEHGTDYKDLKAVYDPSTWTNEYIDQPTTKTTTFAKALEGYELSRMSPANGKVFMSYHDNDPYVHLYYARTSNNWYRIEYYQESVESAQARFDGTTDDPSFPASQTCADYYSNNDGRLGETVSLETDNIKSKFTNQGFTWYGGTTVEGQTSTKSFVVTYAPNETGCPTYKVYYTRNTNTTFRVEYYQEKQNSSDKSIVDNYTFVDYKNYTAIQDQQIYTDAKGESGSAHYNQPTGLNPATDFRVRDDFKGFSFEPDLSNPQTTADSIPTVSYGMTVKLYFSRNTNTNWKVEYWFETLNERDMPSGTYVHEASRQADVSKTGRTGNTYNFSEYAVTVDGFTFNHYRVDEGTGERRVVTPEIVVNGDGSSVARVFYNRVTDYKYYIYRYTQLLDDVTEQPSNEYRFFGGLEPLYGVYGAKVKLGQEPITGYEFHHWAPEPIAPATDAYIEIGTKYPAYISTEPTDVTIGRIFYNLTQVQYSTMVNLETLQSAQDRRDGKYGPESASFVTQTPVKITAYPTQKISVKNVIDGYKAANPGFNFYKSDPAIQAGQNDYYEQVKPDGSTAISVWLLRDTNRKVTLYLHRQSLDNAKYHTDPKYPDTPDLYEEYAYESAVTGETINLGATGPFADRYIHIVGADNVRVGFAWASANPTSIYIAATGEFTGDIYYDRTTNMSWRLGYRDETYESAVARQKDPTKAPVYEPYAEKHPDPENPWLAQTGGIYGDTIDENSYDLGTLVPYKIDMPGFTFEDTNPEALVLDENTYGNADIEFRYLRDFDTEYGLQLQIQDFDDDPDNPHPLNTYSDFEEVKIFNGITGATIDKNNDNVKNLIAEGITGFRFAQLSPETITVKGETLEIMNIQFNRKGDQVGDNPIKFFHYGETKDSANARVANWVWDEANEEWIIPEESADDFTYDTTPRWTETIASTADRHLWTGMTIDPNNYRESTEEGGKMYGFDSHFKNGDETAALHPVNPETFVIVGDGAATDQADIDYGRHVWTIMPDPIDPFDPPIPYGPEWDPQEPDPVPHEEIIVVDPPAEEYVVPEVPEPHPATKDEDIPIYYHEKQIAISYLVNDAALGAVDPQTESYPVVTGLPIGSSASVIGASTFLNWTNEAGEVISTDLNYLPEKYPLPEPELNRTANEKSYDEIYASQVYTANFQAGTGGQTGDNMGFLVSIIMLIVAVNAAYILTNRRRNYGKHTK